jgi:MarR family transcriptional regulator, organic hydroperoxide resistance regulator
MLQRPYHGLVSIETIKEDSSKREERSSERGPDADQATLASEAWMLLQRIAFSQRPAFVSAAREFDLLPPHVIALRSLERPIPMGGLARLLACDNSNVTGIIDRLEERGLVERRPAERDRRVKLVALTPAGKRLKEGVEARMAEPPPPIEALSPEDQRALRDILRRATRHLDPD